MYFQSDMSKLFNEKIGNVLSDGNLHFQSAPVKLFERCVVKSQMGVLFCSCFFMHVFFLLVLVAVVSPQKLGMNVTHVHEI